MVVYAHIMGKLKFFYFRKQYPKVADVFGQRRTEEHLLSIAGKLAKLGRLVDAVQDKNAVQGSYLEVCNTIRFPNV